MYTYLLCPRGSCFASMIFNCDVWVSNCSRSIHNHLMGSFSALPSESRLNTKLNELL